MLRQLRDWVTSRFSPPDPPTREQAQATAQEARDDRAGLVTDLQAQVRSLQQEITDRTAVVDGDPGGKDRLDDVARLVELEKELAEKQRELARFQARI